MKKSTSMASEEKQLKEEILGLMALIEEKKRKLFSDRLASMYPVNISANISDIAISCDTKLGEWSISYTHNTDKYDPDNYVCHDESSDDGSPYPKTSHIILGKSGKKYYLKGGIRFNVYRNSGGELRVTNPEYDFDIDMDEHRALIGRYAADTNIPEACALSIFQYISDNKWDDTAVINYLSVV
jgi:hypothetical protein